MEPAPFALRKNKLRPSCERCRKSKLRCDHTQPCGRCMRRHVVCEYAIAPLTRAKPPGSDTARPANLRRTTSSPTTDLIPSPISLPLRESYHARDDLSLGYLGLTSHAAILKEHENHLEQPTLSPADALSLDTSHGVALSKATSSRIQELCLVILDCIPDLDAIQRLKEHPALRDEEVCSFWPSLDPFYRDVAEFYPHFLAEPRQKDRLISLADTLCRNTRRNLGVPRTNAEWLSKTCGSGGRWELVGLMLLNTATNVFNLPDSDPLLEPLLLRSQLDRRALTCRLFEYADACYRLCTDELKQNNVLTVSLYVSCTWVQSIVGGDSSHALWIRKAAMMANITAFGLHLNDDPDDGPHARLYTQHKRSTVALAICIDTLISTFMGRPPALSFRYVSCPLMLDIDVETARDETISLDTKLDAEGWNKEGEITQTTKTRVMLMANRLRHEILELCFGPETPGRNAAIDDIASRLDDQFTRIPKLFQTVLEHSTIPTLSHSNISAIADIRLEHLFSHLLLARLGRTPRYEARVIDIAANMLRVLLTYYGMRERMPGRWDEFHWMIAYYGIAAASALSISLWKYSLSPTTQLPVPNRSEAIQDLSIFLSALEWVEPDAGNYTLCRQAHKLIKGILDRVLNPPLHNAASLPNTTATFDLGPFSLDELPTFGVEYEEWFENMDWDAIAW